MSKIPFDIKYRPQIESGEYKVETESGAPAKILDWEWNNEHTGVCLAVKITEKGKDSGYLYTEYGKRASLFPYEKDSDLSIVTPEEELTEFEQEVSDIVEYCKEHGEHVAFDYAKRHARTLLDLAKKELLSEKMLIEQTYNPDINKAHELGRKEGIIVGKAEALKDLPGLEDKEAVIKTGDRVLIHCKSTRDKVIKRIYDNKEGKVLHVWDLKRNPWGNINVEIEGWYNNGFLLEELEKLPGFKEDEK